MLNGEAALYRSLALNSEFSRKPHGRSAGFDHGLPVLDFETTLELTENARLTTLERAIAGDEGRMGGATVSR